MSPRKAANIFLIIFFSFRADLSCAISNNGYSTGMSDAIVIPNDLKSCQELITELVRTNTKLSDDVASRDKKLDELSAEMERLRKLLSQLVNGPRSEKRIFTGPDQTWLPFESEEELKAAQVEAEAEAEKIIEEYTVKRHARKKKPRDESLPAHLPRVEQIAEVPEDLSSCSEHGDREVIGYDVTETLVREPPKLYVLLRNIPSWRVRAIHGVALPLPSGRPAWSKAIVTARALLLRLLNRSGHFTCPSIVSRTFSPAVAGFRAARPYST